MHPFFMRIFSGLFNSIKKDTAADCNHTPDLM